ncbi:unnamed protein product [Nezara viridula]|uniref:Uncharacterized protein n=1 Tax=Nezara viridula TaxID=85310 RepID=A0A9P0EGV3_NEZVI|nr:unnamed protein product [Nezara viridula]
MKRRKEGDLQEDCAYPRRTVSGRCSEGRVWIGAEKNWLKSETSGPDSTSNTTLDSGTWGLKIMTLFKRTLQLKHSEFLLRIMVSMLC